MLQGEDLELCTKLLYQSLEFGILYSELPESDQNRFRCHIFRQVDERGNIIV